jgi:hypothetical protein
MDIKTINMNKKIFYSVLSLLVITTSLFSQETEIISPSVQLSYLKNTEGTRILQTSLTYSGGEVDIPLPGMEISFFSGSENKELLATTITDKKGVARFEIPAETKLNAGSDGAFTFSTEFKGNDTIAGGTSETAVKDVKLEMVLSLVDTVKTVTVNASVVENGTEIPVAGETVKVVVPRMFSNLLIGELTLDETGSATVEFPGDIPGDKDGNITVVAMFEENATFGNVEKREILKWGLPTDYSVPKTHRALWTKTAPKWMIYTLSILLAGVWGHYLFAIISLIRINIDAKRKAKEDYKI